MPHARFVFWSGGGPWAGLLARVKMSFKIIFYLVPAAAGMLTGVQSQIVAPRYVKSIKFTIIA